MSIEDRIAERHRVIDQIMKDEEAVPYRLAGTLVIDLLNQFDRIATALEQANLLHEHMLKIHQQQAGLL